MKQPGKSRFNPSRARALLALPAVREAREFLRALDPWTVERQIELTAIPAPPYGEGPRGERMGELFDEIGLEDVRRDEEGNVLAEVPRFGASSARPLLLSAHLDTVFPAGTDVTPRRRGPWLRAPGISDNGRGLACLLTLARVLMETDLPTTIPVRLAATVGEEGEGNLRGVRHLFRAEGEGLQAAGFVSLDGVGINRIVHRGVGSTRLRIELSGPGGHSWMDWGTPNPMGGVAWVVTRLEAMDLPPSPRTTLTVARWGGGTSINAIPQNAWIELDLRSEGEPELAALEREVQRICEEESTRKPRPDGWKLAIHEIGRRPASATPVSEPLVKAAVEATLALGEDPQLIASSTDANVPMAAGIPAITVGAGGIGGGTHTLDEWYANEKGPDGILRALLMLLLLA